MKSAPGTVPCPFDGSAMTRIGTSTHDVQGKRYYKYRCDKCEYPMKVHYVVVE